MGAPYYDTNVIVEIVSERKRQNQHQVLMTGNISSVVSSAVAKQLHCSGGAQPIPELSNFFHGKILIEMFSVAALPILGLRKLQDLF